MTVTSVLMNDRMSDTHLDVRLDANDWSNVTAHLDAQGWAIINSLLDADQCRTIAALYDDDSRFRSQIVMSRHGFGKGEYKYFSYPLPGVIADLRPKLYGRLASLANRWNEAMGIAVRYPHTHAEFITRCHEAGQT